MLVLSLLACGCARGRFLEEPVLEQEAARETRALLARVRTYDDPALSAYLTALAQSVSGGASPRVHVLRDPTLALFAMPGGGDLIVHTGLLAVVGDEAQLAALLGHELAHVLAGDAVGAGEPARAQPRLDGAALASPTAVAILGGSLPLAARAAITGYGEARERTADAVALERLAGGGWDPREAPEAFRRLAAQAREGAAREVFFLGDARRLQERVDSTRELAARLAGVAPASSPTGEDFARLLRGVVRENAYEEIRQGRFEAAERQLDRVAEATPDDPVLHVYYGELHRLRAQRATAEAGRDAERARAQAAYERALALDPGRAEAHRQLGFLFYAAHDLPRAREELERYLALAPRAPDAARIAEYVEELAP